MCKPKQVCAFTLLELLVVVSIVGILIGLILCAIQAARSSAACVVCKSNLRQLVLATRMYADSHNEQLPIYYGTAAPGFRNSYAPEANPSSLFGGWAIHLLPWIEQDSVYRVAESNCKTTDWNVWRWELVDGVLMVVNHGIWLEGVRDSPIPLLRCPADPTIGLGETISAEFPRWTPTNFLANRNVWVSLNTNNLYAAPGSFSYVSKGLPDTIIFGEGYGLCGGYQDTEKIGRVAFLSWSYHNFGVTRTGIPNTYMFQEQPGTNDCDPNRAQSIHSGGMNAAMADGHVITIEPGIDPVIWSSLLLPTGE